MMGLNRRSTVTDCIEPRLNRTTSKEEQKPTSVPGKHNPDGQAAITSERPYAHWALLPSSISSIAALPWGSMLEHGAPF